MRKVEILAPAGSYESLVAAVNAGADAIYIGGNKFGARAYANNLTEEDLLRAIDFVHLHGKKIYITINTLLKNKELEEELYEYLLMYYKQGIDAVIVQDVGVLHFLHEHFSELPIHLSTQMTLTMASGLNIFEDMGVTRLVTSRELSLTEIKNIREHTDLEIESFVHGALCYCYSGQCLMSSMLGGRSGNRGRCAQTCRMPYELKEHGNTISSKENQYLLSPKDICTLSLIPDMIESGIDSFKIEGRMKRPEYTALVVSKYRKYVDLYSGLGKVKYNAYLENHKEEYDKDILELMDIYNRGSFTKGYYITHNGGDMISLNRPNHNGILVGEVIGVKGIKAQIKLKKDLNPGDLLEIREENAGVYEFTVKNGGSKDTILTTNFLPKAPVKSGQNVFRTKNQKLLDVIREEYIDNSYKEKIQGRFSAFIGKPMCLMVSLGDKHVEVYGDVVEAAIKQPMTEEKIRNQLSKTSATEFAFQLLEVTMDEAIFIPVVSLNILRRDALKELELSITKGYRRELSEEVTKDIVKEYSPSRNPIGICVNLADTRLLDSVLTIEEVDNIYLDMADLDFQKIEEITKKVSTSKKGFYLVLPHIFRKETKEVFLKNKDIFLRVRKNTKGFLIKNFEEYDFLTSDLAIDSSKIILDYNVYTMNKESKKFYDKKGIIHYTAPVELNYGELRNLGCTDSDIIVYGYLPLMVSAQCLIKTTKGCMTKSKMLTLVDRYHKNFYVKNYCKYCYNVIYNGQPISLLKNVDEISKLQPKNIRLNFTIENERETIEIIKEFVNVYKYNKNTSFEVKDYTRGHFKRGIE